MNSTQFKKKKVVSSPVTESEVNETNVLGYFRAYPRSSIPLLSQDLGVSYSSSQRILSRYNMHPYSLIKLQAFCEDDSSRWTEFGESMLFRTQEDLGFLKNLIWTDESKFTRNGIINRRNIHYWASENPHAVWEGNFQKAFGFNVFCLMYNGQVHYEIYNKNLNSDKYLQFLKGIVTTSLDSLSLNALRRCYYQLDCVPLS